MSAEPGGRITDISRGWWSYEIDNLTCPISIYSLRSTVHLLAQITMKSEC